MTRKWSNYPTYCVYEWITNEEDFFEHYLEAAQRTKLAHKRPHKHLKRFLKDYVTDAMPSLDGLWHELLTHSLGEVNWGEIADYLLDGLQEYEQENDDD
jgi:hypothetical protein